MLLLLSACGSGGGGGGGAVIGSNSVAGAANKGPFQIGSAVTAYQLDASGVRVPGVAKTTTVTDNLGTYTLPALSWSGLTEVEIIGFYLDENTGLVSAAQATMIAIVNLPAIGSVVNNTTVNPNLATTVAASIARGLLPGVSAAAVLQTANDQAALALGLPAGVNLAALDVTKTADPVLGAANKQLLAVSAAMLCAASQGAAGGNVTNLITSLATDASIANALGTNIGAVVQVQTCQTTVIANAPTIAGFLNAAVTNAGGVADPGLAGTLAAAADAAAKAAAAAVAVRGIATVGNAFTIGAIGTAVPYTIATNGLATAGAGGPIGVNNLKINLTLADYSNAAGTGPKAATYTTSFSFDIVSTTPGDTRFINGTISPVTVTTDGAGNIAVSGLNLASVTYTGMDSLGLFVAGTATNMTGVITGDGIQSVTVDGNLLVTKLNAQLNAVITPGPYSFELGISGLEIGLETVPAPGLSQLLPLGANVTGRAIHGQFTL